MRRLDINIPIYDWKVIVATIYDKNDDKEILALSNLYDFDIKDTIDNIKDEETNWGLTTTNKKVTLMVVGKWENDRQMHNTINHELFHVVSHISEICGLEDEEAMAYLAGYIGEEIYINLDKLRY